MKIETKAVHLGHAVDAPTGAIAPPIYLSTTYEREADGSYPRGYSYSRADNPNRHSLERVFAGLEGGAAAAAFSSGLAAIGAVFQALVPGDHVIAPNVLYHGTTRLLNDIFTPWNLQTSYVDTSDLAEIRAAVRPNTRIIFVETPANPTLAIADISAVAQIAETAGAKCVCDNTWATPVLQQPLALGADLVVHSTTKYFGGHSDVLGGAVVSKHADAFFDRIRHIQQIGGAVPSPFDCWLLLRGAQTLPCRIRNHSESAFKLAVFLSEHPLVERVYYPGLAAHPGYEIACRQMKSFGGMLSFAVKGGKQEALAVTGKLNIIIRGTSLGGVESLIEHRASIEGPDSKTPDNLLRLSAGLENVEDLIADLQQALG
ncbi:PLP-dependent transferase|uniref:aminotransferase class I/II-fold pyridoxal phosphate-dependent enzyme n=1 Tax=Dendrosporobacter quercicolus TaxID=146817 RepID=UPI000B83BD2F|nr:PLP-dependent transferase [Dendrosporobacter quercicolus DSM 1736]